MIMFHVVYIIVGFQQIISLQGQKNIQRIFREYSMKFQLIFREFSKKLY